MTLPRLRGRRQSQTACPNERLHSVSTGRTARSRAADFKRAVDLAMGLSTSGEAAHAYLDWLTVVARDEIAALWPHVEKVAQALVRERTLTATEIKSLVASQ